MSNELRNFMEDATRNMASAYERIRKRSKQDPGTAGDQGEEDWCKLLKDWLPSTFHVVTKGCIVHSGGQVSPQIDLLVLRPEYPRGMLHHKYYLANGVLAAFECKTTLRNSHLAKFAKTSSIIKKFPVYELGTPYKELNSPLIFGLLAHSYDSTAAEPAESLEQAIIKADKKIIVHPRLMPDLICVADLACWITQKHWYTGPKIFPKWRDEWGPACASATYTRKFSSTSTRSVAIGNMMRTLIERLAREVPSLRPIAQEFKVALNDSGHGRARTWPLEIYSPELQKKIESWSGRSDTVVPINEHWSEWARML